MKKAKLFHRVTAIALAAVMICCVAAAAANEYFESLPMEIKGYARNYTGTTILYEDSRPTFRGSAWVQSSDSSVVPVNTMGCCAGLADAESGDIILTGDWKMNTYADRSIYAITPQKYYSRAVFAVGWAKVEGKSEVRLYDSPSRGNARSMRAENLLATLAEDNTYPVNSAGETYGSVLLADVVGEAPDLLSAVNQDGVSGYIRIEDVPESCGGTEAKAIPLYDQDGNVIDAFELVEYEEITVDTTDIEAAKAAVAQLFCQ